MVYRCICLNPQPGSSWYRRGGVLWKLSHSAHAFVTLFGSMRVPLTSCAPGVPIAITSEPGEGGTKLSLRNGLSLIGTLIRTKSRPSSTYRCVLSTDHPSPHMHHSRRLALHNVVW